MTQINTFKNTNFFWTLFGIAICIFLLYIDIYLLIPVKAEKTGEQILFEVGMGDADPRKVKLELTANQFQEIKNLIQKNRANYNEGQKSLISERTVKDILTEVGMGYVDPRKEKLTPNQLKELKDLINKDPANYNEGQKSLILEKTGADILFEVGMGYIAPKEIKLTSKQLKEIVVLINKSPKDYNKTQKSLIKMK